MSKTINCKKYLLKFIVIVVKLTKYVIMSLATGINNIYCACFKIYTSINYLSLRTGIQYLPVKFQEIAKLHAASFVMKHKDPEHFEQLVNQLTEILYKKDVQSFALENQQQQITTVINLMESLSSVDNKYGEAISLLKEVEGKSNDLLTELILSRDKYSIINHGDLWMNNIMHREGQIKFVDLQVMRCTSVAADLHYFLNINVLPHILIKNIEHLFNVYLKFLHFHIHSQGVNLENELNLTWLKSEMQKFSLYGLVNGIWIGVVFYVKEELKDVANFEMDDVMTRIPVDCKMRLGDIVLNYVQMRSLV